MSKSPSLSKSKKEACVLCDGSSNAFFGERKVAVVDEKFVPALLGIALARIANVNIEKTIAIDIRHRHARFPRHGANHAGLLCNILEFEIALIEVQFIGLHIGSEVNIIEAIVVDIANGHPSPIEKILVREHIRFGRLDELVSERDAGNIRRHRLEKRLGQSFNRKE
jgi:hypothetical protein